MGSTDEIANGHWHIRKEISVGHLITTVMLLLAMVSGWYEIQNRLIRLEEHTTKPTHSGTDSRLTRVEAQLARAEVIDAAMSTRLENLHAEILRRLEHTERTLVRIEDRLNAQDTKP